MISLEDTAVQDPTLCTRPSTEPWSAGSPRSLDPLSQLRQLHRQRQLLTPDPQQLSTRAISVRANQTVSTLILKDATRSTTVLMDKEWQQFAPPELTSTQSTVSAIGRTTWQTSEGASVACRSVATPVSPVKWRNWFNLSWN